jgi:ribosomal protein S13
LLGELRKKGTDIMATPAQKGESLVIGIGDYTYAGYIVNSVGIEKTADVKDITNEDGDEVTNIIGNKGKELRMGMIVKTGTDADAVAIGDVVTINSEKYLVTAAPVTKNKGIDETTIELTCKKKDSMTYT